MPRPKFGATHIYRLCPFVKGESLSFDCCLLHVVCCLKDCILFKGGGVQGKFFWRIRFELWAPQVPPIIRETTGEVLGPRCPIVSELRPAQKLGVKQSFPPDGPRGANRAPNCSSYHPDPSHIGFHGSRTNGMVVAAQNAPAQFRCESLK